MLEERTVYKNIDYTNMTVGIASSLAIIAFAAGIHACFQLSVSVLTLLSGHSLGRKTAHRKVLRLMNGFITGVVVLTALLLSSLAYFLTLKIQFSAATEQLVAAIACGLMAGLGVATWTFYYRRGAGTALWLPRGFARHLTSRTKQTKNSAEAFGLGMTSVIAELLFIIGPMLAAALATVTLPSVWWQLASLLLYIVIATLPLLVVFVMVGGGHKVTKVQAWREKHKRFIQFVAGGSLIILAAYIFVDRLLGISLYGGF